MACGLGRGVLSGDGSLWICYVEWFCVGEDG